MVFAMNLLRQSVKPGSLRLLCAVVLFGFGFWASNLQVEAAQQPLTDAANTKAKAAGSEELITDDGTPEVALVLDNAIGVNRLTPSAYPATLQTIRIYFATLQGLPSPAGAQIKLIAFAGASGTTAPPANPTLLFNQTVTIPTLPSGGGFVDFPVQNGPTINSGDFYVGFQSPTPAGGVGILADSNGTPRNRGFASVDNGQSYVGPLTLTGGGPVNVLIRAVVMNDAQPTARLSVSSAFNFANVAVGANTEQTLTVSNAGSAPLSITAINSSNAQFAPVSLVLPLTVPVGGQASLRIRFAPTSAGAHNGTLTIASNDPSQPSTTVSISGIGGAAPISPTAVVGSNAPQTGAVIAPPVSSGLLYQVQYVVYVPAGATQLKVDLTGDQDLDLFVRHDQRVAISGSNLLADFASNKDGVGLAESVTITPTTSPVLQTGFYYVAVANFGPGASNFNLTISVTGGTAAGVLSTVSAASYTGAEFAVDTIAAGFGANLATSTQVATTQPLPGTLAGTSIAVRDSALAQRLAPLFFVAGSQANYLIPSGTANGPALVTVTSGDGKISVGSLQIAAVAPGLFSANSSGQGLASAVLLRVKADNSQSFEPIARLDSTTNQFVPVPIDFGSATDQLFLVMYGTGIRGRSNLSAITALMGGASVDVLYAGPQNDFVGLDQINLPIPRSLAGRGNVDIVLTVDGKQSNTVRINIR